MRSQDIEIPEPCHAAWEDMRPEDRGRYCFECKTKVHDLSSMTQPEAEQFLQRTACEDVCVSYEHTADGVIQFRQPAPRPAPMVPVSRLTRRRSVAAAIASAGVAAALAACAPHSEPKVQPEAEAVAAFQAPSMVIPVEDTAEPAETVPAEPTETPEPSDGPALVEPIAVSGKDEPCDPATAQTTKEGTPTPVATPIHRVRGRRPPIHRTAGRPVRKMGKVASPI